MKTNLKRKILFTLSIITMMVMLIGFIFYTKPPIVITEMKAQPNLPIKIKPFLDGSKEHVLVLIPYKITVSNNRFRRISLPEIYYKTNHDKYVGFSSSSGNSLYFDEDGKPLNYDVIVDSIERKRRELLIENYGDFGYLKLKWENWEKENHFSIFPFTSESIYFYKSTLFQYKTDRNTFVDLYDNFKEKQTQSIYEAPIVKYPKNKVDSLYQADKDKKIAFKLKTNKSHGWFQIHYQMKDGTQKFYNIYDSIRKMNREELFNLMISGPIDGL